MPKPKEPFRFSHLAEELIGDLRGIPLQEPARMKKRATKTLTELIEGLLVKHKVGRHCPEDSVKEHWTSLVGAPLAAYSTPTTLDEKGKLTVLVSHAVARNELSLQRLQLLSKIRGLPGCEPIKDLYFRPG